jgi:hypothetical protein
MLEAKRGKDDAPAAASPELDPPAAMAAWQRGILENYLAGLPPDHPGRSAWALALATLQVGQPLENLSPPLEAPGSVQPGFVAEGGEGVQPAQEPTTKTPI